MRPVCALTFFERTKAVPLFITRDLSYLPSETLEQIRTPIWQQYSRIQTLRLCGNPNALASMLMVPGAPAPTLQSLSLSWTALYEKDDGFDAKPLDKLKGSLLYQDHVDDLTSAYSCAPISTIRTLVLVGFPIPRLPLAFAQNLATLTVSLPTPFGLNSAVWPSVYPSLDRLLNVLRSVPYLTALDLRHCSPRDARYGLSDHIPRTVSLPGLERLTLVDMLDGLVTILLVIRAPSARLRIGLYGDPNDDDLSSVFKAIQTSCGRDITHLHSLHVFVDTSNLHKRITVSSTPTTVNPRSLHHQRSLHRVFLQHDTTTFALNLSNNVSLFSE